MTLPPFARDYLTNALDHTPATVAALLGPLPADDPAWDVRPFADRFTLREIVAHLADWESVWRDRFTRTVAEDAPFVAAIDLDRRIMERGYAAADPAECLSRLARERAENTARLRAQPADAWDRAAHLEGRGDIPLTGQAALMLAHDAYHLRQIAEWRTEVAR